jgi:hypothetical protein
MSLPKSHHTDFIAYLRRVGADYDESGCENTARDYRNSANRIERFMELVAKQRAEIAELRRQMARVQELSPDTARLAAIVG